MGRPVSTILDRIKQEIKQPFPRINNKLALKPKRAIFPSLKWGRGGPNFSFILFKMVV